MSTIPPPVTLSCEGTTLECEAQVGSLNTVPPTVPPVTPNPYVPPALCVGTWQITGTTDQCAINEAAIQASYVAESLNISGAPINVYPLLGVHQQGNGSLLSKGTLISSHSAPGYPLTGINGGAGWRSFTAGSSISSSGVYIGIDFGIKLLSEFPSESEYEPQATKWTSVGAISITQSNNPGYFASQVRVDTANGDVSIGSPVFSGVGNGSLSVVGPGFNATQCSLIAQATSSTTFSVYALLPNSSVVTLGTASIGIQFNSTYINFTITSGSVAFVAGDMFTIPISYIWCRAGVFNTIQSPSPQILSLNTPILVKAIRVTPILFTGAYSWEVDGFDVLDSPPPSVNNIQDLFFNENRDRDYASVPIGLKVQYSPADSISDLSRFGLSILDQYVFTVAFASMVTALGRPIVVGDIIEVIPELQYDQNLKPIRKFLEVTDSGWSSAGFSPAYQPLVYRFTAQQAMPSQETRDIFGTMDTTKYLIDDSIFNNPQQVDTIPLTRTEEITKAVASAVPETGSDDNRSIEGLPIPQPLPPRNPKGEPTVTQPCTTPNLYIADALPPNGLPYTEGYSLPNTAGVADGAYFRLYYPDSLNIPPRLYKYSLAKNAWIFLESDKRAQYTSVKPSLRKILESSTSVPLNKKLT